MKLHNWLVDSEFPCPMISWKGLVDNSEEKSLPTQMRMSVAGQWRVVLMMEEC